MRLLGLDHIAIVVRDISETVARAPRSAAPIYFMTHSWVNPQAEAVVASDVR